MAPVKVSIERKVLAALLVEPANSEIRLALSGEDVQMLTRSEVNWDEWGKNNPGWGFGTERSRAFVDANLEEFTTERWLKIDKESLGKMVAKVSLLDAPAKLITEKPARESRGVMAAGSAWQVWDFRDRILSNQSIVAAAVVASRYHLIMAGNDMAADEFLIFLSKLNMSATTKQLPKGWEQYDAFVVDVVEYVDKISRNNKMPVITANQAAHLSGALKNFEANMAQLARGREETVAHVDKYPLSKGRAFFIVPAGLGIPVIDPKTKVEPVPGDTKTLREKDNGTAVEDNDEYKDLLKVLARPGFTNCHIAMCTKPAKVTLSAEELLYCRNLSKPAKPATTRLCDAITTIAGIVGDSNGTMLSIQSYIFSTWGIKSVEASVLKDIGKAGFNLTGFKVPRRSDLTDSFTVIHNATGHVFTIAWGVGIVSQANMSGLSNYNLHRTLTQTFEVVTEADPQNGIMAKSEVKNIEMSVHVLLQMVQAMCDYDNSDQFRSVLNTAVYITHIVCCKDQNGYLVQCDNNGFVMPPNGMFSGEIMARIPTDKISKEAKDRAVANYLQVMTNLKTMEKDPKAGRCVRALQEACDRYSHIFASVIEQKTQNQSVFGSAFG